MIVWGGNSGIYPHGLRYFNNGGRYNPSTDTWTVTSTTNAPDARSGHTAIWTGSEMIVWGGGGNLGVNLNTGGRYCAQAGPPTITLSALKGKRRGINAVRLTWGGPTSTNIDLYPR
jgi:hypothetical protein